MRVVKPIGKVPRYELVTGLSRTAFQRSGCMTYFAKARTEKVQNRARLRKKNTRLAIIMPLVPFPYGKTESRLLTEPVPGKFIESIHPA